MSAVLFTFLLAGPFQLNNLGSSTTFPLVSLKRISVSLRTLQLIVAGVVETSLKACKIFQMSGPTCWFWQTLACLRRSPGNHFRLILMKALVMNNLRGSFCTCSAQKRFCVLHSVTWMLLVAERVVALPLKYSWDRYTSDKKMIENSCSQTEWAAWKKAKEKREERHGQLGGGCTQAASEAEQGRGPVHQEQSALTQKGAQLWAALLRAGFPIQLT